MAMLMQFLFSRVHIAQKINALCIASLIVFAHKYFPKISRLDMPWPLRPPVRSLTRATSRALRNTVAVYYTVFGSPGFHSHFSYSRPVRLSRQREDVHLGPSSVATTGECGASPLRFDIRLLNESQKNRITIASYVMRPSTYVCMKLVSRPYP